MEEEDKGYTFELLFYIFEILLLSVFSYALYYILKVDYIAIIKLGASWSLYAVNILILLSYIFGLWKLGISYRKGYIFFSYILLILFSCIFWFLVYTNHTFRMI